MDKRSILHQFYELSHNYLHIGEVIENVSDPGFIDTNGIDLNKKLLSSIRRSPVETGIFSLDNHLAAIHKRVEMIVPENKKLFWNLENSGSSVVGNESSLESLLENIFTNAFDEISSGEVLNVEGRLINNNSLDNTDEKLPLPEGFYYRLRISSSDSGKKKKWTDQEFSSFFNDQNNESGIGVDTFLNVLKQFFAYYKLDMDTEKRPCFALYLPVKQKPQESNDLRPNIQEPSFDKKIMVIDDEIMICEMIADMLSGKPYETIIFQNGFDAIEYYKKHSEQVAIIILDMIMPEISGKKTFQLLREVNPNVKVLISSGYSKKDDAKAIIQEGALEYLQKPYSFHNLQDAISRHI